MGICPIIDEPHPRLCLFTLWVITEDASVVFMECVFGRFTGLAVIMSDRKLLAEVEIERHGVGLS